tara:strand:- start:649 stop:1818 length:1170 start_codon:yes stop_codon:yes gene_type:complete
MQYLMIKSKIFWIFVLSLFWCNFGIISTNADELYGGCIKKGTSEFNNKVKQHVKINFVTVMYFACTSSSNWSWRYERGQDFDAIRQLAYKKCLKGASKYNIKTCHLFSINDKIVYGKDPTFIAKVEKEAKARLAKNIKLTPTRKNISGFVLYTNDNPNNLAPISKTYKGKTPKISLINGEDLKIIIWSHGTNRPQKQENCLKLTIPETLFALSENNNVYFYFLCSRAIDGDKLGSYIYKRKKEINKVLDQLISVGIKPKNIFLAGQSAGGWTSLMMMDQLEKKFNSAIVFAPAFAGPRSEIGIYPKWRREERPRQIRKMIKAKVIKALIFVYEDDPYNRPKELMFLKEKYPNSVEMVGYKCGNGHSTAYNDCRFDKTKQIIKKYFEKNR